MAEYGAKQLVFLVRKGDGSETQLVLAAMDGVVLGGPHHDDSGSTAAAAPLAELPPVEDFPAMATFLLASHARSGEAGNGGALVLLMSGLWYRRRTRWRWR
jgi:hypothetical protein